MCSLLSIDVILTGFVDQKAQEHLAVALEVILVITVQEDVAEISRTYLPIKAAISLFIEDGDQVPLILQKKHEQKSLTLIFKMG